MNWSPIILYLFSSGLFVLIYADLFTSVADLQRLLQVEKGIPELINSYIESENARLNELKRYLCFHTNVE